MQEIPSPESHHEAIQALGGPTLLYSYLSRKSLKISLSGVEGWSKKGRIPSWWRPYVAAYAVERGRPDIDCDLLDRLAPVDKRAVGIEEPKAEEMAVA